MSKCGYWHPTQVIIKISKLVVATTRLHIMLFIPFYCNFLHQLPVGPRTAQCMGVFQTLSFPLCSR